MFWLRIQKKNIVVACNEALSHPKLLMFSKGKTVQYLTRKKIIILYSFLGH